MIVAVQRRRMQQVAVLADCLAGVAESHPDIETMFTGAGIDDDVEPVAQIIRQWLVKIDDPLVAARRHDVDHGDIEAERSEEHTSELQSLMRSSYAVFCLKKKNTLTKRTPTIT